MNSEIQWFIYSAIENKLLTKQECDKLIEDSDKNIDLNTFAQEVFNQKSELLDDAHAEILLNQLEKIMTDAVNKVTQKLDAPEILSLQEEEFKPDFTKISDMSDEQLKIFLRKLLLAARNNNSSDLHLSANAVPFVRHMLNLQKINDHILTSDAALRINTLFLSEKQKSDFIKNNELVYILSFEEGERYRVVLMHHKDGVAGTYHIIPRIRGLGELGFKQANTQTISKLIDYYSGLIIIGSHVGHGKTTTLASLVDMLNIKRYDHIIMIEDLIEIIHVSHNCNITQREISTHTKSYADAIKSAFKEDSDIIVIEALDNPEMIRFAITAAETGHLVIGNSS